MNKMRSITMGLALIAILLSLSNATLGQTTKLMTYNIRYANPNDGENYWENRKEKLAGLIKYYEPAFLGIQEGLIHQVEHLDSCLDNYTYVGVGRDDGKQKGEFCALYYDTTIFRVISDATFWLSETPDIPSNGWDANLNRVCTYGLFEHLGTKKRIWVMNTHFDHRGRKARENSARLIVKRIGQINAEKLPLVLMGDFNATPEDIPIEILTAELSDGAAISEKPLYGPPGTANGFRDGEITKRIDYLFTSGVKVLSYAHIDDRRDNNLHVSDHQPVIMEIGLSSAH
jgi:endonuclease/exonuclease/phosphatase family metal-dependent hydrolase